MRGTTRKRGSTWSYQFAVVEGGKRRQIQRGGFRTKKQAEEALADALAAHGKGDPRATTSPSTTPLAAYLDDWLDGRHDIRPSTLQGYRRVVRNYIRPHLDVPLRDVTSRTIADLYATMRERGGRNGKPVGERVVQQTHAVLRSGLQHAVETGALALNPADAVPRSSRPKVVKREMRVWTATDAKAFLTATADDRLHPLWALALDSGMRRGELLGLRWADIDLDLGRVAVRYSRIVADGVVSEGPPKSGKARTVDISPGTVAALRRWRKVQVADQLAAGSVWATEGHVFTDEVGAALHPDNAAWHWGKALRSAPVPTIRFHDVRHTSATLDLAAGVHPKVVQERLGHSSIALTLDLYSHVIPGMGADAARARGALLYGPS